MRDRSLSIRNGWSIFPGHALERALSFGRASPRSKGFAARFPLRSGGQSWTRKLHQTSRENVIARFVPMDETKSAGIP